VFDEKKNESHFVYVYTKAFLTPTTHPPHIQSTDYYKDLGIPKTASLPEIKKAYKKMSRTCHPDIVPDKLDEWHKVSRAYEVRHFLSIELIPTFLLFFFHSNIPHTLLFCPLFLIFHRSVCIYFFIHKVLLFIIVML
jgi:hypothetical protein